MHFHHDGLRLAYRDCGAGPAMLFLHGFTTSSEFWAETVAALPGYRSIALDLRGHGDSDAAAADGYRLDLLSADAVALLDHLGLAKAVVIGHSLGGMVTMQLMRDHPGRLDGSVLVATTPRPMPEPAQTGLRDFAAKLPDIPAAVRQADPMLRRSQPISAETARGCVAIMGGLADLAERLKGSPIPSLILYGDADSPSIQAGSAQLAEALPQARMTVIPGAGHVPPITHADIWLAALTDFLGPRSS